MKLTVCLKGFLCALAIGFISGCSRNNHNTLILWTDNVEFASYAELFNSTQNDVKVAVVYKNDLLAGIPVKKGHTVPDILAGSYLKPGIQKNYFSSLNSIFTEELTPDLFYQSLLESGKKGKTQYLMPVSFNLGTLVFDQDNQDYVECQNSISIDQLKTFSKNYNMRDDSGSFTRMGFAPQWNPDFLYSILNTYDINFTFNKGLLKFNMPVVENCKSYLESWTKEINNSFNDEKNFAYVYLFTPYNKQVLQQKSLFAYTTSSKLLALSEEQLDKIDFRWFSANNRLSVEEDEVTIGVYKKSANKKDARKFISWFMNEQSQAAMIKRTQALNLDTTFFGIAGGFSSIISVNEHVFPTYYKCLLPNMPNPLLISSPRVYPKEWHQIKKEVIESYLLDELNGAKNSLPLTQRYSEWYKQNNEE